MVVGDHLVAERAVDAVDGVADHGGTDVTDVHLLGGIGGGVVDHHLLAEAGLRDVEVLRGRDVAQLGSQPVGGDGDVEEAGPGQLQLLDERRLAFLQLGEHGLRDLSRRLPQRLGGRQRVVALEVAELGVRRGKRPHVGEIVSREGGFEPRLQPALNRIACHQRLPPFFFASFFSLSASASLSSALMRST